MKIRRKAPDRSGFPMASPRDIEQLQIAFGKTDDDRLKDSLLAISLEAAVPLWILRLMARKGPKERDWQKCRDFAWTLGSYGDRLLFRSKADKHGPSTAEMFNGLAECIAIMSYVPGGIKIFGTRWETPMPGKRFRIKRAK